MNFAVPLVELAMAQQYLVVHYGQLIAFDVVPLHEHIYFLIRPIHELEISHVVYDAKPFVTLLPMHNQSLRVVARSILVLGNLFVQTILFR